MAGGRQAPYLIGYVKSFPDIQFATFRVFVSYLYVMSFILVTIIIIIIIISENNNP